MQERDQIQVETWKLVSGSAGVSTTNQALIDAAFPLTHPEWYYNTAEGKGNLLAYCQDLLVGFKATSRQPAILSAVYDVRQESD